MIYTSNYARKGEEKNAIAISRMPPDYYTGQHLDALAPSWDILGPYKKGIIDKAEYASAYLAELKLRNVDPLMITQLPDETFLLCYESPTDFCHRHILTKWIKEETGVVIPEWKNEKEQRADEQDQLVDDLFGV